jgi:hypothetical protein
MKYQTIPIAEQESGREKTTLSEQQPNRVEV